MNFSADMYATETGCALDRLPPCSFQAMEEQRVEPRRGRLVGDAARTGEGEFVRLAHHEGLEGEAVIKTDAVAPALRSIVDSVLMRQPDGKVRRLDEFRPGCRRRGGDRRRRGDRGCQALGRLADANVHAAHPAILCLP
jgi:hypothetical protein